MDKSRTKKVTYAKSLVRNPCQRVGTKKGVVINVQKENIEEIAGPSLASSSKSKVTDNSNISDHEITDTSEKLSTKLNSLSIRRPCSTKSDSVVRKKTQDLNLKTPKYNTVLHIDKKIGIVEKKKPTRTKSLTTTKGLALDDKVTKHVNFHQEKSVFKGLIPLSATAFPAPVQISREPLPPRDKEPLLSDFITPIQRDEFSYVAQIKLEDRKYEFQHSGLRLYNILQSYNE